MAAKITDIDRQHSSNIKRLLNLKEKKFAHVKSHDCHVLMTQLLPVALRGILPANVRATIIKLCAFLNAISHEAIDPTSLIRLQKDVVQSMVCLEMIFPPSFFNIMTHLLVHLVKVLVFSVLFSFIICSLLNDTLQS